MFADELRNAAKAANDEKLRVQLQEQNEEAQRVKKRIEELDVAIRRAAEGGSCQYCAYPVERREFVKRGFFRDTTFDEFCSKAIPNVLIHAEEEWFSGNVLAAFRRVRQLGLKPYVKVVFHYDENDPPIYDSYYTMGLYVCW